MESEFCIARAMPPQVFALLIFYSKTTIAQSAIMEAWLKGQLQSRFGQ